MIVGKGQVWIYQVATLFAAGLVNTQSSPGCVVRNLNQWSLQLPNGSPGDPETIQGSSLAGCPGFNSQYFFTGSDNSMVMTVPGAPGADGCVTTPNSEHCRCELHENISWSPNNPFNIMAADLIVVDSGGDTCIGQIHIDASEGTSKPAMQMYYMSDGTITAGVENTRTGGGQTITTLGAVPLNTRFTYEISWNSGNLQAGINGNLKNLDQQALDNPLSYFKAGNYLQGDNFSEVHFFDVQINHDSGSSPITGGSGAASGSGVAVAIPPCNRLGPCNVLVPLTQPETSATGGGTTGGGCNTVVPTVSSASTTTLELFSDGQCCHGFEHIKLGNLNECKTAGQTIGGFWQANGQNQFGQDIHVMFFDSSDCSGSPASTPKLTNQAGCQAGGGWKSFMIAKMGGVSTASCSGAVNQPTNSNSNDLTISLFGDTCCDSTPVETAQLGALGTCHQATGAFQGFSQSVGSSLFGRDIHLWAFTDQSCGGDTDKWEVQSLTNNPTCFTGPSDQVYWSFAMINGSETTPGTFSSCDFGVPDNKGDDNTVTLELYSDNCCTSVETITLGNSMECKKPNGGSFVGMAQSAGANMFGQGIKIWSYTSDDCTGQATSTELSHNAHCNVVSGKTYKSFQMGAGSIAGGAGSSSSSSSGSGTGTSSGGCALPTVFSATTVNVGLYSDSECCTNTEMAHIGNLGECKEANGGSFNSIAFAAGADEFGNAINVWIFTESGCGGFYEKLELKSTSYCESIFGGSFKSFMVDTGTSTAGPTHNTGGAVSSGGSVSSGSSGTGGCQETSQTVTSSDPNVVQLALYSSGNAACNPCNGWASFSVTGVANALENGPETNCFSGFGTPFSSYQIGITGSYPADAQIATYLDADCTQIAGTLDLSITTCAFEAGFQFNSFNFIGGNSPPPPPAPSVVATVLFARNGIQDIDGDISYDWPGFDITSGVFVPQICDLEEIVDGSVGGFSFFPPNLGPFSIRGFTGCEYTGDEKSIGSLSCDGNPPTRCEEGPEFGVSGSCGDPSDSIEVNIQCDIFS